MRFLLLKVAILIAVTTTSANGLKAQPPTPDGGGSGQAIPWEFGSPLDGMQAHGSVLFAGTGPVSDVGGLSIYSYSNTIPGDVYPSELQLQIGVIVSTDPGVDWVGPIYQQIGESYATIMPALGTINITLLALEGDEIGTSTLVSLGGGDSVLFRIIEP